MSRRQGLRPLGHALDAVVSAAAPQTLLARVQAVWPDAVGAAVAAQARPVSEHAGVVTVECGSAVWAQEVELLAPRLLGRLRDALGEGTAVQSLRVRTGARGQRP